MLVRSLLLTLTLLLTANAGPARASGEQESPIYDSCCLCIHDVMQEDYFISACKRWINETRKSTGCSYRKIVSRTEARKMEDSHDGTRCRSLHLYGAFHGTSDMAKVPFKFSALAAKAYGATSVCYDGMSCLVFDNIEDVKACALDLSKAGKKTNCRYQISGNQNLAVAMGLPVFCLRPRELSGPSSKLTAFIDDASVTLQYSPCSKPGGSCAYEAPMLGTFQGSTNDPNAKWCTEAGVLVSQQCCPKKGDRNSRFGKWSAPGGGCP